LNNLALTTEQTSPGEWVTVNGISEDYLGTIRVKVGDVEQPAYVEGSTAMVRCPKLEAGAYPVRVDSKRIGNLTIR